MSASAYGQVVYGYRSNHQLLRVADGRERVCQSNPSHVIVEGGSYCPRCGSSVRERDRMVPSPAVVAYAAKHEISPEGALSTLVQFQHEVPPRWFDSNDKEEDWVFGVTVVDGGTNSCTEFNTIVHPDLAERLSDAVRLFTNLGLDPVEAKYYLLVRLS